MVLTWALSTCPLTMSRKTLGLAVAIARTSGPGDGCRLLVRRLLVALETDGKSSGTNFSAVAISLKNECAGVNEFLPPKGDCPLFPSGRT